MAEFPIRPIDFSIIGQLPELYAAGQKRAQEQQFQQLLQGGLPRGPNGEINWAEAANLAARAGNVGGIEAFSRLRNAEATRGDAAARLAETIRHNKAIEGRPQIVGSAEGGYYAIDRNGNLVADPTAQPQAQPAQRQAQPAASLFPDPGGGNVLPQEPVEQPQLVPGATTATMPRPDSAVATGAPAADGPAVAQAPVLPPGVRPIIPGKPKAGDAPDFKKDPQALIQMAAQARAGDTSVFVGIGRGTQGPENLRVLRAEMARQDREAARDDQEDELRGHGVQQAMKNAEYFGTRAGQRTLGTRVANIELAATEFKKLMPVVEAASDAVDRTKYTNVNQLILAWRDRTGDPATVSLGGAINTAVNIYARAINPTGASTVSDKEHAREILQRAWSTGQIKAALQMMSTEIDAALTAPDDVREEWRRRFRAGAGQKEKPATAASPASGPKRTKSGVTWSVE